MRNKEVIDALTKYFVDACDPKIVARTLAGMMIDLNRIDHINELPEEEKCNLIARVKLNNLHLKRFIENGPDGPLKLDNVTFYSS